ncbi:hypothetical protein GUITHDRAFT_150871, partial [Guillardia theta CCMP2712]
MLNFRRAAIAFVAASSIHQVADAFSSSGFSLSLRSPQSSSVSKAAAVSRTQGTRCLNVRMGSLAEKYGHLRGADIEPCGAAVERFYKLFARPIPFVFRAPTNEILYLSHLDLVNAMFRYDVIWAAGLYSTFDLFFSALDEDLRANLFQALMGGLKLDQSKIKSDADAVLQWAQGKTEADVVSAIKGEDSSPVGQVLASLGKNEDFLYTRNFGAGLIKIMQVVGVEPNAENAKRWAEVLGFTSNTSALSGLSASKFETDVGLFLSSVDKMQQAMQLFAEVEAREKKKIAEKLAEKAARAAEEAAKESASS